MILVLLNNMTLVLLNYDNNKIPFSWLIVTENYKILFIPQRMRNKYAIFIIEEQVNQSVYFTVHVYYLVAFRKNALPFAL